MTPFSKVITRNEIPRPAKKSRLAKNLGILPGVTFSKCPNCRDARGASLLWGLSSVDCGRSDYFIFLCDGVAIFAVMRKVLILALAMQASGPTRISRRTLPCKALVTPTAQRVAEWKKKTE